MKTDLKTILFISNGYGEDAIAVTVIKFLQETAGRLNCRIAGFPLVGEGGAYAAAGIPVISPTLNMPSGGLIPGGWFKNLWMDFRSGLAALTLNQISHLRSLKNLSAVVAVGDTFPVLMGGLFTGRRVIFIGTAKSDYFVEYSPVEREVFKKFADMVFPRDEPTASTLRSYGIEACWVGNAMMDGISATGQRFGIDENRPVITILPGSRDFAYEDLPLILESAVIISGRLKENPAFISALAPSLCLQSLEKSAFKAGFEMTRLDSEEGPAAVLKRGATEVLLLKDRFGDAITMANLIIGQAGTGNEQAAGLGKPVIGFDSEGRINPGWYRARQKGLLGDALAVVERDAEAVAEKAAEIFEDAELYRRMSEAGKKRMGPPGGALKMARFIEEYVAGGARKTVLPTEGK